MHRCLTALVWVFACIVGVSAAVGAETGGKSYWQLIFKYDSGGLALVQATPIQATQKQIKTPGLEAAPLRVAYRATWQDAAGTEMASTPMEIPIGVRVAFQDSGACELIIPEHGLIVVRIPGPPQVMAPTALTLTATGTMARKRPDLQTPAAFSFQSLTLPVTVTVPRAPMDGPIGSVKLRDTGPDDNRIVIGILGDGYTPANLSDGWFTGHANNLLADFTATPPWDLMFSGTNVYRIDVASNQQGVDHDPYGTFYDTYFNASFWVANIERLVAVDDIGYYRAIAAADAYIGAGLWDQLVIIANSTKYGGSGGGISVVSANSWGPQVVLHELGHSMVNLADEYTTPYPGFPPGDGEPNVDYDASGPGLKWLVWVSPGTPLPTPDVFAYYNSIGAFQGARYLTTGIYRPSHDCLMRSLGVPLDVVCQEAHLHSFFGTTSFIDAASPGLAVTSLISPTGVGFSVTPIPFSGLVYEWFVNGAPQSADGASIAVSYDDLVDAGLGANNTVKLRIRYPTDMMRLSEEVEEYVWAVEPDCNSNGVADKIDIQNGTSSDGNSNGVPDDCEVIVCCEGTTGNVNMGGIVDLADLSLLVAYLTLPVQDKPVLPCIEEANVNGLGIVDLGDLSLLVAYLTVPAPGKPALPNCP